MVQVQCPRLQRSGSACATRRRGPAWWTCGFSAAEAGYAAPATDTAPAADAPAASDVGPIAPRPVARARTWLLKVGWRRHGLRRHITVPAIALLESRLVVHELAGATDYRLRALKRRPRLVFLGSCLAVLLVSWWGTQRFADHLLQVVHRVTGKVGVLGEQVGQGGHSSSSSGAGRSGWVCVSKESFPIATAGFHCSQSALRRPAEKDH